MLTDRFGFEDELAGTLYATPYMISAILSPILGITIDKVGKRPLFSKFPILFTLFSPMLIFLLCSHVLVGVHIACVRNHYVDLAIE